MRIAIFDGILELHVHQSLARALRARGHEVLATGKVGHGFQFPDRGASLAHLERALDAIFEFEPEWMFVMRPASLPPQLLERVRKRGIQTVAWFSDDPVLFDLSYAPVLEQYDRVLHCGTAAVLAHYEQFFGRPTGVNFPFWTDHTAFPVVWGEEQAESRAMFLGNVHDLVRRRRYFDLAKFGDDIRIHGQLGTDYFDRSGGYLDSDAEVVAAGARTTFAINIPQWFRDHRGLETWFPGLDELGFFEYPSRVIQTMAMGVPTISIIPPGHRFETFPEMLVATSVDEAVAMVRDPSWSDDALAQLSKQTAARFDRHFSADARVVALERFLIDDSWRSLPLLDRARWFADTVDQSPTTPGAEQRDAEIGSLASPAATLPDRAVVMMSADASPLSAATAFAEALVDLGVPTTLVPATHETFDTALKSDSIIELRARDLLLVVGLDVALPGGVRERIAARTILVTEFAGPTTPTARIVDSFDVVGLHSAVAVERFNDAGFDHVTYTPRVVSPSFARAVASRSGNAAARVIRVAEGRDREDAAATGLSRLLDQAGATLRTWDELSNFGVEELAAVLRADLGILVPAGPRRQPRLDDLFAHATYAVHQPLVPRNHAYATVPGLAAAVVQFAVAPELGRKLWRLDQSERWRKSLAANGERYRETLAAPDVLLGLLGARGRHQRPGLRLRSSAPLLDNSATLLVPFSDIAWTPRTVVRVSASARGDATALLRVAVLHNGSEVWSGRLRANGVVFAVAAPRGAGDTLMMQIRYDGEPQDISPAAAFRVDLSTEETLLPVPLQTRTGIRVVELEAAAS